MTSAAFLLALVLAVLFVLNGHSARELVEPALTIYIVIAGFLIILLQKRSWEFIRPLVIAGLALLLLPPLFRDLVGNLGMPLNFDIGFGWLWIPALIVLGIVACVLTGVSAGRRLPPRNRGPYPPPGASPVRRPHQARGQDND